MAALIGIGPKDEFEGMNSAQILASHNAAMDSYRRAMAALAPDHTLVIGWRDLAAALDQRTVRVEEKLRIVDRAAVALIDADRDDHVRLLRGLADRIGVLFDDDQTLEHAEHRTPPNLSERNYKVSDITMKSAHDSPILVTGAAGDLGAIGRNLTALLLAKGHKVRALVRRAF